MKVAILVSGIPPEHNGGTEIATMEMAKCAVQMGHDIHVISPAQSGYSIRDIQGVQVHRVKTLPAKYLYAASCTPSIVRIIAHVKPDLIHAQGAYFAVPAAIASTLTKIPYLFSERGSVHVAIPIKTLVYRTLLRKAAQIVAQTEYQKNMLERYTNKNIEVIPNGIDAEKFGRIAKNDARISLGLPVDPDIVLAVGRCRAEKNFADFVRVALSDRDNTSRLYVLIGDGPELDALRRMTNGASNIVFKGNVGNDTIPTWMSAADVLVNTSLSEGFPVTLLEAMASGLPVVASRVCGIPEILEDGVNGLLSEPQNYESTAHLVDILIKLPRTRTKMAETNKAKARRYTWESVVKMLYG